MATIENRVDRLEQVNETHTSTLVAILQAVHRIEARLERVEASLDEMEAFIRKQTDTILESIARQSSANY